MDLGHVEQRPYAPAPSNVEITEPRDLDARHALQHRQVDLLDDHTSPQDADPNGRRYRTSGVVADHAPRTVLNRSWRRAFAINLGYLNRVHPRFAGASGPPQTLLSGVGGLVRLNALIDSARER
jgi:hypothetical protein